MLPMIQGRAEAQIINVEGHQDYLIKLREAKQFAKVLDFLKRRPVDQRAITDNQVLHHLVGNVFYRIFGASAPPNEVPDDMCMWDFVYLGSHSSEPVFSDDLNSGYYSTDGMPSNVASRAWKYFGEEIETHTITSEDLSSGYRAIYRTWKWVWYPDEANSSSIRSLIAHGYVACVYNYSTNYSNYGRSTMRLRFKDDAGNPIQLVKNTSKCLMLQYQLRLLTL